MRLTIIKSNGYVSIDGEGYFGIDVTSIDNNIHAIQWHDTYGELEIKNEKGRIIENVEISNIADYLHIVPLWQAVKDIEVLKNVSVI